MRKVFTHDTFPSCSRPLLQHQPTPTLTTKKSRNRRTQCKQLIFISSSPGAAGEERAHLGQKKPEEESDVGCPVPSSSSTDRADDDGQEEAQEDRTVSMTPTRTPDRLPAASATASSGVSRHQGTRTATPLSCRGRLAHLHGPPERASPRVKTASIFEIWQWMPTREMQEKSHR